MNGNVHFGSYTVENGWITVVSDYDSKHALLRQSPSQLLAEIMLREMIESAEKRGELTMPKV